MFGFFQVVIGLSLALFSWESSAQIFDFKVDYGGTPDPAVKALIDGELAKIKADINEGLPSTDPDRLMKGMADSSVMAGKGIGTDYASNMKVFLIGAGVGAGADLTKDKKTDGDLSGVNVASGIVMGLNLGFMDTERIFGLDTNRLNVYANYMGYNYDAKLNSKDTEKSTAGLNMTSGGIHFRYDAVKGAGSKALGWGGIKVTWGYEYNKTRINFKSQIKKDVSEYNGELSGTISGSPEAQIDTMTHSLPLAFSTDIQILYILSLYTGVGADYNMGTAKAKGALNGQNSTITCSSGATCTAAGNPSVNIQPIANIDGTGRVTPFTFRGFAGVQVNLPWTRIFAQVDKAFGNNLIGATAGLRFAF